MLSTNTSLGNQGAAFAGAPLEGFGWVNASYVYGMTLVPMHMRRALGILTTWERFEKATEVKLDGFDHDDTIDEGVEDLAITDGASNA